MYTIFSPYLKTYLTDFPLDKTPVFIPSEVKEGDYIETYEALETYMRSCEREYTQVVVYNTKTDYRQRFEKEDLENFYRSEMNISEIPFHFLILQNGNIQVNKLIGKTTNHTTASNHLQRSISIAFVGGFNNGVQDMNTCTPGQWKTFKKFIKCFYSILPGGQVWGHDNINPSAYDPGFNVIRYIEKSFSKRNTLRISQLSDYGAPTTETLISMSRERGFN
jgi:hypothetical protein